MLEFYDPTEDALKTTLTEIKHKVLGSSTVNDGEVSFKFPSDYTVFFNHLGTVAPIQPAAATPATSQFALAAHTIHGKLVENVDKEHEFGKGGLAYNAVKDRLPAWPEPEANQFQKNLKRYIQYVGQQIGLLFETKVFKALVKGFRLQPTGDESEADVEDREQAIIAEMKTKTHNKAFVAKLDVLVNIHALDMARDIMQKAKTILRHCHIDQVIFQGGTDAREFLKVRNNPADITVACSQIRAGRLTTPAKAEPTDPQENYQWLKDFYAKGKDKSTPQRELYLQALNELLEEKQKAGPSEEVPF